VSLATKLIRDIQKVQEMLGMDDVGEDTTHNMPGTPMGVPPDYKGLARVTHVSDDMAKKYWGVGYEFYVDMQRGETDLMTPNGVAASIPQVSSWFKLTPVYGESSPASMNSGGGGNAHPSHPHSGEGGMHAPSKLSFGMKHDDDDDDMGEDEVAERRHRRHKPDPEDDDDNGDDKDDDDKEAMGERRHKKKKSDDDDDSMDDKGDDDQADAKAGMGESVRRRRVSEQYDDDEDEMQERRQRMRRMMRGEDDRNGKDGEGDQIGVQAFLASCPA
jgi:hypothetical protein